VVMNRFLAGVVVLAIALAVPAHAQQKPATAADKAAAEKAMDDAAKRSVEMAEALARAQQRVAEEARQKSIAAEREAEAKYRRIVPVDLEVVISRYQADKKTSSLPYALTVNTVGYQNVNDAPLTSLRMGGEVPLPTMSLTVDGKPLTGIPTGGPITYKAVGTNIDARGRIMDGGQFEIWVSVQDDAIATPQGVAAGSAPDGLPVIRSFRVSNNVVLKDGQTRQFTAAADRITGEVVKVDVTLKVAK
jgi:hypothetical protein